MKDGYCSVEHGNNCFITKVPMTKNRMFPLKLKNVAQPYFSTMVHDNTLLCHIRLGHLTFNGLKLLYQNNMEFVYLSQTGQDIFGAIRQSIYLSFPIVKSIRAKAPSKSHSSLQSLSRKNYGKFYMVTFYVEFFYLMVGQ